MTRLKRLSENQKMMSDLTKILAGNRKEMLKLIAATVKKTSNMQNIESSDSEAENTFITTTSTRIKSKTSAQKSDPVASRNRKEHT